MPKESVRGSVEELLRNMMAPTKRTMDTAMEPKENTFQHQVIALLLIQILPTIAVVMMRLKAYMSQRLAMRAA